MNQRPAQGPQGTLIERHLDAKGITRVAFAESVDLSTSYMLGVIRGERRLTKPETIQRVADALGVNPDLFYLALDRLPPDVVQGVVKHPELIPLIRRMIEKKEQS